MKKDVIAKAYKAFNARDIVGVLSLMHPDVKWPNGWEGGYVYGHAEVKDYWTRQWKEINPNVLPERIHEKDDGRVEVEVHQLVKDLEGKILADGMTKHVYSFENGLITKMEIEEA